MVSIQLQQKPHKLYSMNCSGTVRRFPCCYWSELCAVRAQAAKGTVAQV